MGESPPTLLDLVDILMSTGLPPETSLRVSKEIDQKFGLSARAGGSDQATRERWRLKKAKQRARRTDVPGGQSGSTIREVNNSKSVELDKKTSKSKTKSPGTSPGRSKGDVLPPDWAPTESHYAKGRDLGMSKQVVDDYAQRMRNWADANAHRQVARKAGIKGWNAAFSNWLASAHERNNGGGSNGKTQAAGGRVGFSGIAAGIRAKRAGAFDADSSRPAPEDLQPVNRR